MQERVLFVPCAKIFLAERWEDPSTGNILAPCKLLSLERSYYEGQTRQKWQRVVRWLITTIKADHFVLRYHELIILIVLFIGSYSRQHREQKGPNCLSVHIRPPSLTPSTM